MRKKKLIGLLLLISSLYGCYDAEIHGKSPAHPMGTAYFAGVSFKFNFYLEEITLKNNNNDPVKVKIHNLYTNSVLVNDLITWPGKLQVTRNLRFSEGEQIEISIWQGFGSVWDGNVKGRPPDFLGTGYLSRGEFTITPSNNKWGYKIDLPIINGAECSIIGQYLVENPALQLNNLLYCERFSSDTLRVELYKLKPRTGGGYRDDFELVSFWLIAQIGERIESGSIHLDLTTATALGLRVTTYDPYDNIKKVSDIFGFFPDVANEDYTEITGTIVIDPVPPPPPVP